LQFLTNIFCSYRREARRRAAVYRDQPESPLDRAVFWTEYVLRHKGAPHLRCAGARLPWYQLYLLDVAAPVVALLFLIAIILRYLFRLVCGSSKQQAASKIDKKKKKQ
jgi:glucuronosyltransferase